MFDAESRVNLAPRRRRCGWVGWRDALFPHMTVRQNLLFAAGRWARLERTKRVAEMLERFELADALEMRPRDLTPARRLRAEVARALIAEPKVLLVDDRGAESADEALLGLVRTAFDGPVLWVTGRLDLCYSSADQLALVEGGRVVGHGAAREVIERPESVEAARLAGISNLYPATIAALDPGRNQSRLECEDFVLTGLYLKGHFKGRPRLGGHPRGRCAGARGRVGAGRQLRAGPTGAHDGAAAQRAAGIRRGHRGGDFAGAIRAAEG